MLHPILRTAIAIAAASLPLCAQRDATPSASVSQGQPTSLLLKYGSFDPLAGELPVPAALAADQDTHLFVVQFHGRPTAAARAAVAAAGATIHGYLPHDAYVVRMDRSAAARVATLPGTRYVGGYHPAYRLERFLIDEHLAGTKAPTRRYHIVVVDKRNDKPALARRIEALGGRVVDPQEGSILFDAELDGEQLLAAARLDEVLWIDRWSAPETDMDNARIQGGANYVEANLGYTGQGVRGHVYEGVEANHQDFTIPFTNVSSAGGADTHGHCTAGIVFGNGTSNPAVRGMAPDATPFFTQYGTAVGSRNSIVGTLVNTHQVMFTTASWGDARTRLYTSVSADADDIVFDHRIPWTQSQSNAGNQDSRPQAWAKNVFSIGGVRHYDNANPADDRWAGGGSTGPAADGRIKPDLAAYYDSIGCSDRTGSAGYSSANWYSNFGGTSGATPIVAGHNAIAIQMYTDGLFRNQLPVPGGTRFQNRPLAQTLKALMIANAEQYPFTAASSDNRREHVGWGFPSLRNMYDNQAKMLIVAEDDVLTQGLVRAFPVAVAAGEPELKVCMTFVDPAGNPAASLARINDLSLRVTSPSGVVYWGNQGLTTGNHSVPGGAADTIDTVECVFVQSPEAGTWTIEVDATLIAQDAHVATTAVDATYALCAVGVGGSTGTIARFQPYGSGCAPVTTPTLPTTFYEGFGAFDLANAALRFTPNGAGGWTVTPCANCFDSNVGANLNLSDDQLASGLALGFSFPLPGGGASNAIAVDSNGWIGLVSGQHTNSDFSESVAEFLSAPARIAAFWDDLNPATGGSVHFVSDANRALITWLGVPEFSATGANTGQIQLFPNGEFVLAYGAVSIADCLVGFSVGNGAADPGQQDISNPAAGTPLGLAASAPPRIGTTITMSVDQLPAAAAVAVLNLGLGQLALDLTPIGMPGCTLLTSLDESLGMNLGGAAATQSLTIPNSNALLGAVLYAQGIVIAPGANTLGVLTSNGGTLVIGN
jgi:hypothetical protein